MKLRCVYLCVCRLSYERRREESSQVFGEREKEAPKRKNDTVFAVTDRFASPSSFSPLVYLLCDTL